MAQSKFAKANQEIARKVTGAFEKIQEAVVGSYAKAEDAVIGGYAKVEDAFVERFLTRDGETAEEAKARFKQDRRESGERPR